MLSWKEFSHGSCVYHVVCSKVKPWDAATVFIICLFTLRNCWHKTRFNLEMYFSYLLIRQCEWKTWSTYLNFISQFRTPPRECLLPCFQTSWGYVWCPTLFSFCRAFCISRAVTVHVFVCIMGKCVFNRIWPSQLK